MSERKAGSVALGIVFLTVFLDLVGFGIVLPLLPFYATDLGASPFEVGLIIASYSAMQFLFAPVWGALSDRYGRRPLLLLGLFGSAASYVVFGLARSLEVLLLSRVIAGIMGANIPVAQAYIADSTTLEGRARGMGLIGAAFGLGFIFGPAIGGGLSPWGYGVPGFVAAGLSLAAATAAWFWLPESLAVENRVRDGFGALSAVTGRARAAAQVLARKRLREPIGVFFLGTMGFAGFTTIFPLFLENPLGLTALYAGGMFALVGMVSAGVQGALIGPMVERYGEQANAAFGGAVLSAGVIAMGLAQSIVATIVSPLAVGVGWGLLAPSLQSLVSRRAMANEQGQVLGVNQSASALARVIGPVAAGWAYGALGPGMGFVAGGLVIAAAAAWVRVMPGRETPAPAPPRRRVAE
ncbi:MAG: MFS transporter [Gemmatimonadetes bacterium]|nr:MFS transporter [Gemmatimonadota bacterium]